MPSIAALLLTAILAVPAAAQSRLRISYTDPEPAPRPGQAITAWERYQGPNVGSGEMSTLYVRNDTTVPIALTSVRLIDCININMRCNPFVPTHPIVAPGEVLDIAHLRPAGPGRDLKVVFDVDWRVATECGGPRDLLELTGPPRPAASRTMILPPIGVSGMPRKTPIDVTFFVAANGTPDSIVVPGLTNQKSIARLWSMMKQYRFAPALDGYGCPVPGTATFRFTMD